MKLKDFDCQIMNLILFDLDNQYFVEYDPMYNEYDVIQIFADEIEGQLCVCIDVTVDENNIEFEEDSE